MIRHRHPETAIKWLEETSMDHDEHTGKRGFFDSRANIVLVGFLAIGAYFLITEHGAHIIPFLPRLLILACPLMHLFMHHGHHGGSNHSDGAASDREREENR